MTDDETSDLRDLTEALDRLTDRLDVATDAMRRTRRHLWLTILAVVLVVAVSGAVASDWVAERRDRDRAACERVNAVRAAVIDAASTAVRTTATELTAGDAQARAEAVRIAHIAADAVARDPDLAPRDC